MLTGLILAGCVTTPTSHIPDWEIVEREKKEAADPMPLPALCSIPWDASDVGCWAKLDNYDIVAYGNTEIARANTRALRETELAYDRLVDAGKLQNELSQIRHELLEQERYAHRMDNFYHRGLIVLGVLLVAL